jgi:hypothetical protein
MAHALRKPQWISVPLAAGLLAEVSRYAEHPAIDRLNTGFLAARVLLLQFSRFKFIRIKTLTLGVPQITFPYNATCD